MKLTTKGHYAVTAVLDIALNSDWKPVPLSEIAARQSISLTYLEQLFIGLRKRSIVKSIRGINGGYFLQRSVETLSIAEIIEAVDEKVEMLSCHGNKKGCKNVGTPCLTHALWTDLGEHINRFLSSVTISHLMQKR